MVVDLQAYSTACLHPDCDFIDGRLEARYVGLRTHSALQGALQVWFWESRNRLQIRSFPSLRVKISPVRIRIPDVCVVTWPVPNEQVLTSPPLLVIEVLSPEDTLSKLQQRLDDYLNVTIPNIWVIDPESRRGWSVTVDGHFEARDRVLRSQDGRIVLPLAEVYAIADE